MKLASKIAIASAKALQNTIFNGGSSTSSKNFKSPTSGYMVGGWHHEFAVPMEENDNRMFFRFSDAFSWYLTLCHEVLEDSDKSEAFIGTWVEGHFIVFDVSMQFDSYEEAMQVAKAKGERAIYDVAEGKEIKVQ
jgi:hypothetical protein